MLLGFVENKEVVMDWYCFDWKWNVCFFVWLSGGLDSKTRGLKSRKWVPFRHKDVCQDLTSRAAGRCGNVLGRWILFTCVLSLLLQQGEDRWVAIYQHVYLFYASADPVAWASSNNYEPSVCFNACVRMDNVLSLCTFDANTTEHPRQQQVHRGGRYIVTKHAQEASVD